MAGCIELLEQALRLGEQELGLLEEGDVDSAERIATDRARIIAEASKDFPAQDADVLREKLEELLALQKRATVEAKSLHEDVRGRLGRTKKEVKRMAGYKGASKPAPLVPNRFLNRKG